MTPSYLLGLFFILLVSLIWAAASVVVQYLYQEKEFHSPFLLTYIGTSLFIVFLPIHLLWEQRWRVLKCCCCCLMGEGEEYKNENKVIPWRTRPADYHSVPSISMTELASISNDHENIPVNTAASHSNQGGGGRGKTPHQNDLSAPLYLAVDPEGEDTTQEEESTTISSREVDFMWSHEQHMRVALKIAPMWFFSNWTYNASLNYTSITSSTVLASTGSLFTFLFAVLLKDESFQGITFVGVLCGVLGSLLTAWNDVDQTDDSSSGQDFFRNRTSTEVAARMLLRSTFGGALNGTSTLQTPHHFFPFDDSDGQPRALFGDLCGLLSAVGYGAYALMIRLYCPRNERLMSMQLLLGYIGLINMLTLLPLAILFYDTSLTWLVLGFLVVKGLLDNVLSDYLWARSVVLTSATVATVGLGLTIPLAVLGDWIRGHADNVLTIKSACGALAVLTGFVCVNLGQQEESSSEDETHEEDEGETGLVQH